MRLLQLVPDSWQSRLWKALDRWITSRGYVSFDVQANYAEDGLFTLHNAGFRSDPRFGDGYRRGVQAGEGVDPGFAWRVHVALWAAESALRVPGDFVECGVNAGFVSSAVMRYLDWAHVPRRYFLVDTFAGPVLEQFSPEEVRTGKVEGIRQMQALGAYVTDLERLRRNFAEWPNAILVQGVVPDILPALGGFSVAFLHIDLNCAYPERAALEFFWDRLSPGALVLFDDYAHEGMQEQKQAIDNCAGAKGRTVLALPTGQGLLLR